MLPVTWRGKIQPSSTKEYREIQAILSGEGGFGGYARKPRKGFEKNKPKKKGSVYVR